MSTDISAIIERARAAATQKPGDVAAGGSSDRARLEKVAQEFESMLLTQMLREMRQAGEWQDEESKDTFGAETMYDTLDTELAQHLTKAQGLGLSAQMLKAFDRYNVKVPTAGDGSAVATPGSAVGNPAAGVGIQAPEAGLLNPNPGIQAIDAAQSGIGRTAPNLNSEVLSGEAPDLKIEGKVTSAFGWRHDPFTGQAKFHKGIDLRAAYGQDIKAAADGRVVFSGTQRGYGNTVLVEHADGTKTRYAHLSATLVEVGDKVGAGQPIGQAGHSGRATGTHLHFEVIAANGKAVDPQATRQMAMKATGQDESSGG